ncbi:putative bacteriophage tail fiber protein [Yersinia intermedia]|nr:hypothetical protein [Yersinia intermedia]CNI00055.1 putative bacteriophage tail fiber protein [Yersinia intermedia]
MQKIGNIPNTRADNNGEFTDGNVAGGVPPTILPAEWFNTIQRELISILSAAGITPDSNKFDQVSKAVSKLITDGGFLKTVNNLSEIKTAGAAAVAAALENLGLTGIGIGLPNMSDIANFDWQNFVFTAGANYVTTYNTWVNPPAGITYNAGTRVSIRVIYISNIAAGPRMGLEITPDTSSAANFKVYKLLCVGGAGSRVFTFNQDWSSANPVPITGGGTGAITASAALANLGLSDVAHIPFVQTMGARMVSFLTAGTFTFTVPDGVTRIRARVVGGGGGAGGSGAGRTGGGGGGGGYAESWITVTPGQVLTIIVGSAGNGGWVSGAGSNGGASSVSGFLSASGGLGGAGGGVGTGGGGIGGVGTGGQFNTTGSDGIDGTNHSDTTGAAGAAGSGGGSVLGGMTRSGTGSLNATGIGSGGSCSYLYIAATGGNGHDGTVILEY